MLLLLAYDLPLLRDSSDDCFVLLLCFEWLLRLPDSMLLLLLSMLLSLENMDLELEYLSCLGVLALMLRLPGRFVLFVTLSRLVVRIFSD